MFGVSDLGADDERDGVIMSERVNMRDGERDVREGLALDARKACQVKAWLAKAATCLQELFESVQVATSVAKATS